MDVEIRPVTDDEFEQFARSLDRAFGEQIRDEDIALERKLFEPDRSLAVFEDGRIVGTAGAYSLTLTIPGGTVLMPGVTAVGVQPTHRRRGLLTSMMRRQLDDIHERGEPIAALWASEGAIYQRFGYGLATLVGWFDIDPRRTAFARPMEVRGGLSFVERDEAMETFPAIHDRMVPQYPGMLARTPAWWEHDFADLEHWREGFSPLYFAMYRSPEGPDGYVAYRVKSEWPEGLPRNELKISELMAVTTEAYAALWRFCFDIDLVGRIKAWGRPADEPLLHMLAHPRALGFTVGDGLWLRLVDVPAALAARRYSTEGSVVLDVRDTFCPWNEGTYELVAGPDGAECRPTTRDPEIVATSADLAAAFLGGVRLRTLNRAGRAVELTPGALARTDTMFGWDPPPWCPKVF